MHLVRHLWWLPLVLLCSAVPACRKDPQTEAPDSNTAHERSVPKATERPLPEARDSSAAPKASGPNVILISIDTLRPDHLGCYGYHRDTSPAIDRIASEGVLFENTISSSSWTLPAHAAMFSSLSDSVHGCMETDRLLGTDIVTLAERFAEAGYVTAGFFAGPYLHPVFGLGQGFGHYENCTSYRKTIDSQPAAKWAMNHTILRASHQDITNPTVYQAVRRWLKDNRRSPFFLFIHLWDVHFDFIPPEPYRSKFDPDYRGSVTGENFFYDPSINASMDPRDLKHLIALYDGEIAWTDAHVAKIYDDLRADGLLDSTVLAITADHGTEFFEHGAKSHRATLFDEVVRIPLIVRFPSKLPGGARVTAQTRIIDIGPTLLDLAGLPKPEGVMGHSLVSLARGKMLDFNNQAICELFSVGRRIRAIRTLDGKLIDNLGKDRRYYFNLQTDPIEHRPLHTWTDPLGQSLLTAYRATLDDLATAISNRQSSSDAPSIPADVLKQLQSLGYVGGE